MADEGSRIGPDAIFTELRDRICLLDMPPGSVLREADLARRFGVSRTPVREALQRLIELGLVISRNGVGTIVTDLDPDAIRESYEMRLKVSELIGHMTPRPITDEHLEKADRFYHRAIALRNDFTLDRYFALNHEVHFLIATIIGNSALREIWDRLYFQTARAWYQASQRLGEAVADDFVRELEGVREAIRRRDPVALGYGQRNHIAIGYRAVQASGPTGEDEA